MKKGTFDTGTKKVIGFRHPPPSSSPISWRFTRYQARHSLAMHPRGLNQDAMTS